MDELIAAMKIEIEISKKVRAESRRIRQISRNTRINSARSRRCPQMSEGHTDLRVLAILSIAYPSI